mgnify:CR=1
MDNDRGIPKTGIPLLGESLKSDKLLFSVLFAIVCLHSKKNFLYKNANYSQIILTNTG